MVIPLIIPEGHSNAALELGWLQLEPYFDKVSAEHLVGTEDVLGESHGVVVVNNCRDAPTVLQ